MFSHTKHLQYFVKPEKPDPLFAKRLQEVIGGQFGEMSVMMQYLFQGWNCRGPAKYRDMLLDIGTEEIGHVEMLATMVAHLLEGAPVSEIEGASKVPVVGAVLGGATKDIIAGMNPQHLIVSGQGATPTDSVGMPWNGRFIIASGNLLADFRANLNAETQGRLQVCRLYEMTDDPNIKDFLSFLIARDTMHQNQWLAALEEIVKDGLDSTPAPASFPQSLEKSEVAYQFLNFSQGTESAEGGWANGESPDGKGQFEYVETPVATGGVPALAPSDPRLHSLNPVALAAAS